MAGPWLGHHTKTYLKRQLLQPRSTTALRPKYCSSNHAKDKLLSPSRKIVDSFEMSNCGLASH